MGSARNDRLLSIYPAGNCNKTEVETAFLSNMRPGNTEAAEGLDHSWCTTMCIFTMAKLTALPTPPAKDKSTFLLFQFGSC